MGLQVTGGCLPARQHAVVIDAEHEHRVARASHGSARGRVDVRQPAHGHRSGQLRGGVDKATRMRLAARLRHVIGDVIGVAPYPDAAVTRVGAREKPTVSGKGQTEDGPGVVTCEAAQQRQLAVAACI